MDTISHPAEKLATPAPSHSTKNLGRLAGAVGVVLLCSTPLTWLLTGAMGPMVWGKLTVGTLMVALYLSTNADFFARLAGSRSTGLFAMSASSVAITLGVVGSINYVAFKNPRELDLTRDKLFTLSPQTREVLEKLNKPVEALAFIANTEQSYTPTQEVLERYRRVGSKFNFEMVDPQSRPDLVQRYHITEQGPRLVIRAAGEAAGDGSGEARAKDASEQELTYAIAQVTQSRQNKVYFLLGHGEADLTDREHADGLALFADSLQAEGFGVETLDFSRSATAASQLQIDGQGAPPEALTVPADAAVVVVAGGQRPITPPEAQALGRYVDQGGRLVAMLNPGVDAGLDGLLASWRIAPQNDLVVDPSPLGQLLGLGAAAPMVQPATTEHPITQRMSTAAVMDKVRSLKLIEAAGVEAQVLVQGSEAAWGETHLTADGRASRDADDNQPPVAVAIASHRRLDGGTGEAGTAREGRLVAFGDSDWITNKYLNMQGNRDLALNTLHWAVEEADKITIRPKGRPGSQLYLSAAQLGELKFFSIDILPTLIVAMGLGIVLVRRQR